MLIFLLVVTPLLTALFLLGVNKLEGLCDETWL